MAATPKRASTSKPRRPPATTPEGRENQMIALAVGLAERQMEDGTASAQVITHFLKLATTRSRLEEEKIRRETELLKGRTDAMASAQKSDEMYEKALNAFRTYSGQDEDDAFDD